MKKLILFLSIFGCFYYLIGCSFFQESAEQLETPTEVKVIDDMISWNSVINADFYNVYSNNEKIEVQSTSYIINKIEVYQEVYISAASYDTKKYSESDKSSKVLVMPNEFLESEIMRVTPTSKFQLTIAENIMQVIITGNPDTKYTDSYVKLNYRALPLNIIFNNVDATAPVNSHFLFFDGNVESNLPLIIVESNGTNNSFKGGNNTVHGNNGKNGSGFGAVGGDGYKGNVGYSAFNLSSVLIKGNSNINLLGGKGSNGGNGGDGHKLVVYTNYGGNGGNGGDGGFAAKCNIIYLKLSNGKSIAFTGGDGGNGGKAGNEVLTHKPSNGKTGKKGEKFSGNIQVISGVVAK